jgi:hypothetical protein
MLTRRFRNTLSLLAVAGLSFHVPACTGVEDQEAELEPEDLEGSDGKADEWNRANNPAYVDSNFLYFAHQLPIAGDAERTPWPGDYWATARDNLNHTWDSSGSPATKWAAAFGRADTPEQISKNHGVKSATWQKVCETSSDCSDLGDGSSCVASYDGEVKRCIPGWWGICHGWAPAAIAERAPRDPVTVPAADGSGDVTFYPGDIEGLMSLMYTRVPTLFISSRCNKDEPTTDASGRLVDGECRDMNPGTWHIITTNLLGLRKTSFVLDRTYDAEVWNQPMTSFRVTNAVDDKAPEVSKAEAASLLGLDMSMEPLLGETTIRRDEWKQLTFNAGQAGTYTVKLSGTGDADLYVRKGAEPTASAYDCRPYDGTSDESCEVELAAGETLYVGVNGYADESSVTVSVGAPSDNAEYVYNTRAERFFYVEQEFCYIVESSPARTANDPARYTTCENVSYVLEADADGKIMGGEWVGASRTNHPDFAWWPTATPTSSQAGGRISYGEVKDLLDRSAGAVPGGTQAHELLTDYDMRGTSSRWKSKYVALDVEQGVTRLDVTMTGTGDADLYVRKGRNPTVYVHNCKSVTADTSSETCSVAVSSPGTYFIRARTRTPGTVVSITAETVR